MIQLHKCYKHAVGMRYVLGKCLILLKIMKGAKFARKTSPPFLSHKVDLQFLHKNVNRAIIHISTLMELQ